VRITRVGRAAADAADGEPVRNAAPPS